MNTYCFSRYFWEIANTLYRICVHVHTHYRVLESLHALLHMYTRLGETHTLKNEVDT